MSDLGLITDAKLRNTEIPQFSDDTGSGVRPDCVKQRASRSISAFVF